VLAAAREKMIDSSGMPGKSVAQKLLIKAEYNVYIVDPPPGYLARLQAESPRASISDKRSSSPNLIQVFVSSDAELKKTLPKMKELLSAQTLLWVTYPKGSSKLRADINRDTIREFAQSVGFETVSLIAIDDVWSALRLKKV
jgi:hypothetical protein